MNRTFRMPVVLLALLFVLVFAGCGKKAEDAPMPETPAAATAQTDPAEAGNLSGIITFAGEAPTRTPLQIRGNPECAASHPDGAVLSEDVVVKDGKLQNVFVYVKEGLEGRSFPAPKEPVQIANHGCVYVPHVTGAQTGQPVVLKNDDPTLHNIHSYGKVSKPFNLGLPFQGMRQTKTFAEPEVMIQLKCDVHPWMNGYLGVLAHPFFSVSDEEGRFELKGLPPGKYVIEAWHEKLGAQSQTIEIGPRESKTVEFTFSPAS